MPRLGSSNPDGGGCRDPGSASSLWRDAFSPGWCVEADAAGLPVRVRRAAGQRTAVDQLDRAPRCDTGDRVCAADKNSSGPVNVVAPNPVTNLEFTRSLAGALHRPAVLPVP